MDTELFQDRTKTTASQAPLADRLRPAEWEAFVGQEEIVGEQSLLRRAVSEGAVGSLLFWGPPGSGKTTLARLIAAKSGLRLISLSAVLSGVKELKEAMQEAEQWLRLSGKQTILFIDEIHRFNKAQQDALLPYVEKGSVTFIGATTENPSFEVNSALLSRCRVYVLHPLGESELLRILERARATDPALKVKDLEIKPELLQFIASQSHGDARRALNILEFLYASCGNGQEVTMPQLKEVVQKALLYHDKTGDRHYDLISALHKSVRNSDPQAALYWLARMLEGGEDPLYVARRLIRAASEDIGLAEPKALTLATSAADAVHQLGMPEGALALAQVAVYLALCPKSNSLYTGYKAAAQAIEDGAVYPVPLKLRNAVTKLDKSLGYGAGYLYAHDFAEQIAAMDCLPDELSRAKYYQPKFVGWEARLVQAWQERLSAALKEKKHDEQE